MMGSPSKRIVVAGPSDPGASMAAVVRALQDLPCTEVIHADPSSRLDHRPPGSLDGIVVVLGLGSPDDAAFPEAALLDATDGILRTLQAAAGAGARRAVVVSTLALVDQDDATLAITEDFCSRPSPELSMLSFHLGEVTAREAARDGLIDVTILRVGILDDEPGPGTTPRPWPVPGIGHGPRISSRQLLRAVANALAAPAARFSIVHVHSDMACDRFPLSDRAVALLGATRTGVTA